MFNEKQKLAALAFRFYQHAKWEPEVGDYYCLTREGLELFQISRSDGDNFYIKRVFAPGQEPSEEMSDPWPIAEFQSGFGDNRVWVPKTFLNIYNKTKHDHACVAGPFGSSLMLRDGTKVCIVRGENAASAHVWLENIKAEKVNAPECL